MKDLKTISMNELREYADSVLAPYFVSVGEGETMANQLTTATCKIVHRYYNDGDRFDRSNCANLETYANRIRKHCFKFKTTKNYEEKLRRLIIRTIENVEKYKDLPKKDSVYTM